MVASAAWAAGLLGSVPLWTPAMISKSVWINGAGRAAVHKRSNLMASSMVSNCDKGTADWPGVIGS